MAENFVRAARLDDVEKARILVVNVEGEGVALFAHEGGIYAVDNRCPHMGFPLHRGTLNDGILTCHWHHARFDLASGGTFDLFADDVRAYPAVIRGEDVWIDLAPRGDPILHQQERLREGLENNIPLVIAKAVIFSLERGGDPSEPFRIGLNFGTRYRRDGWGPGLTMHTAFMNLLPFLKRPDRARALYHGLSAVAWNTEDEPARFVLRPLPTSVASMDTLKRWFRRFIEVRDHEGAERCVVSAVRGGASSSEMAEMLFAAASDHRYLQTGHVVDFTNKAFEALDIAGWGYAEQTLTSLAYGLAKAPRMEESNSWRNPVDLVSIVENACDELPSMPEKAHRGGGWDAEAELVPILLGDDPKEIADALLGALSSGATSEQVAATVTYAASLRIAQFHISNEFSDWDTSLHTFSFANAVHQGLRRVGTTELLRAVFDAAMSIYLDRFLNVPATRLPDPQDISDDPTSMLAALPDLLNKQQQVNRAGELVARFLNSGGESDELLAVLGELLLREDRDFHTIQTLEAAFRQFQARRGTPEGTHILVAAARYLAAHSPTVRAQGQTFQIARRLFSGERLYEGD